MTEASSSRHIHTLHAFDQALSSVSTTVLQMGAMVSTMVADCVPIFLDRDATKAKALIQLDLQVDSNKGAILAHTLEVIARHQPVASDLRLLMAIEHIARDLERSGDHAKNIAKRTLLLGKAEADTTIGDLIRSLHAAVKTMFRDSLTAFETRDPVVALELHQRDQVPDAINDDLLHAVIAKLQTSPSDAPTALQALFVGKSLERIGDHATNIADEVRFLARGVPPKATRSE